MNWTFCKIHYYRQEQLFFNLKQLFQYWVLSQKDDIKQIFYVNLDNKKIIYIIPKNGIFWLPNKKTVVLRNLFNKHKFQVSKMMHLWKPASDNMGYEGGK